MNFTKEQICELMCKHAQKENGLQELFEIMLESMTEDVMCGFAK